MPSKFKLPKMPSRKPPIDPDEPIKPQPIAGSKTGLVTQKKPLRWLKPAIFGTIGAILLVIAAAAAWFFIQLSPASSTEVDRVAVNIIPGSSPADIGQQLEEGGIIRSGTVFELYTRIIGKHGVLQAGTYRLTPSESVQTIVRLMTSGDTEMFNITLYPGATLVDNTDRPDSQKLDVTTMLKRAGYTDAEIEAGLSADYPGYTGKLFRDKPSGTDLEGYIFGDTYRLNSGASVEDIIKMSLSDFWKTVQTENLIEQYEKQGLNLYEAITLASIVQREASPAGDDMAQIAQVFYSRLRINMPLGSDVTYQYIADKTGVARNPNLDSPYNTRRYTGLPPGPIAVPSRDAMLAVAYPADGDYLYFLSGDDDVTYFAKTFEEHKVNIVRHCSQKCQIL